MALQNSIKRAKIRALFSSKEKAVLFVSISTPGELNTGAEGALHTTVSASNVL